MSAISAGYGVGRYTKSTSKSSRMYFLINDKTGVGIMLIDPVCNFTCQDTRQTVTWRFINAYLLIWKQRCKQHTCDVFKQLLTRVYDMYLEIFHLWFEPPVHAVFHYYTITDIKFDTVSEITKTFMVFDSI